MKKNLLGQTGIYVSALGLGTVKFGRCQGVKYPFPFELPDEKAISNLLAKARDFGINLLDTAPAYGVSEERLGKLLRGQRQNLVITTKAGEEFNDGKSFFNFSKEFIKKSVERSLVRLHTDYIDILLIHSDGNDKDIIHQFSVFETLEKLKCEGKIRAYGMSTKTVEGALLTLQQADVVMMTYNPDYTDEKSVLDAAAKQKKGIFIKKAFSSGHYKKSISEILQFILQEEAVTSVIMGTINPKHLAENVQGLPLSMR